MAGSVLCPVRRRNPVGFSLQSDCLHSDRRLARELRFDRIERRVARRDAVTVTIGLYHHIDKIRIIE